MTCCSPVCFPSSLLVFLFSFAFPFPFFVISLHLDLLTLSSTFHYDHQHVLYIHIVKSLAWPGICFFLLLPLIFLALAPPLPPHTPTHSVPPYLHSLLYLDTLTNLVIGVHNTFHRNQKKITHINMANRWGSGITEPLDNRYLGFRVGIAKTGNPTQQCTKLLTGRQLKSWLGYTINKCSIAYKTLGFKEINMFRP